MKKDVLFLLLTCVGLGLYANSVILSSHLSEISKGICLILSSFVFSSVALMVLVWVLRGTWSTAPRPDSLNRLATLAKKEQEISTRKRTTSQTFDLWEELHEQDLRSNNDWKLTTQCNCPWDRPCVCPERQ